MRDQVTREQADCVVCAEFPEAAEKPLLHSVVCQQMMHAPCGTEHPRCPCMVQGRYMYPRDICPATLIALDQLPHHRRRESIRTPRRCNIQFLTPVLMPQMPPQRRGKHLHSWRQVHLQVRTQGRQLGPERPSTRCSSTHTPHRPVRRRLPHLQAQDLRPVFSRRCLTGTPPRGAARLLQLPQRQKGTARHEAHEAGSMLLSHQNVTARKAPLRPAPLHSKRQGPSL